MAKKYGDYSTKEWDKIEKDDKALRDYGDKLDKRGDLSQEEKGSRYRDKMEKQNK